MKIKDGFILREIAGNFIVIAIGNAVKDFNGVITLNETGAFLWKQLENGATKEQLLEALLNEYEVDNQVAEQHIDKFIEKLTNAQLLK